MSWAKTDPIRAVVGVYATYEDVVDVLSRTPEFTPFVNAKLGKNYTTAEILAICYDCKGDFDLFKSVRGAINERISEVMNTSQMSRESL